MPLRLMVLFVIVTPLAGIVQLENGAFGANVNVFGYPNGATLAFLVYSAFLLAGAWWSSGGRMFRGADHALPGAVVSPVAAARLLQATLAVSILLALSMVFALGGAEVLTGDVGKGEFRSTLGGLGALAYLIVKWIAPATFALACATYVTAGRPRRLRPLLLAGLLTTFVTGLAWGFKSSGLLVVLPGFVVLLWQASMRRAILYAGLAVAVIALSFVWFDTIDDTAYSSALEFLVARLTVFQGDVCWYIWDRWRSGEPLPDYARTLLVAMGDQLFSLITGITRADSERWVLSHFGSLLTYTVGYPIEGIEAGHSVTGTPFSEGLIAAGWVGIPLFGFGAGLISGFVFRRIDRALKRSRILSAALWSNYSVWCLFAWLNGGEIVQMFHISTLVGALLCWIFLAQMQQLSGALPRRARRRRPVATPATP